MQGEIGEMLRGFWEVENQGTEKVQEQVLSPIDQRVMKETVQSLKFENNRYEVGIPWREKPELPNNFKMLRENRKETEQIA